MDLSDAETTAAIDGSRTFESAFRGVQALRTGEIRRAFQLIDSNDPNRLLVEFGMTAGEFAVAHLLTK